MNRLENKVALVTGAASGIGLATVERFVEEGAKVLLTDINSEAGEAAAERLGDAVRFAAHDVGDDAQWQAALDAVQSEWGRLDVLVNNAGMAIPGTIEDQTDEAWQRTIDINLRAVMKGTQLAIAVMKGNGGGSIVNVASIEGLIGEPLAMAYNASKGGVRIFSKSAAKHCALNGYNIRVNCICPGFIETPLVIDAVASMDQETAQAFQTKVLSSIPLGRMGQPVEIANGIVFLASDESSFMTGADLVIDGGNTA